MKRLLPIILCLTLPAILSGCSGQGEVPPQSAPENIPATSSSESPPTELSEPSSARGGPDGSEDAAVPSADTLRLAVPEGYTLARIGMALEEVGVCTTGAFIAAAQEGDFSAYPLLNLPKPDSNRCFQLEGYLSPATYEIYSTESPDAIIRRMLDHMESKISTGLRAAVEESGYSFDEILTLASIIEKEAFGHEAMPLISSVLHNRLDAGMQLQCDVTIAYVEGAIKPFITGDPDRYNADYNTYKCPGIPAGVICNPSLDAIRAALNPEETDFLFFLTDAEQNYHFTADWEEHQANIEKYLS